VELEAATTALAQRVARGSSRTLEIGKRAFYEQLDVPIEDAYAHAKEVMALNAAERDAQEGMGAFLQKREPVWEGRVDPDDPR
jgi:enoyl-CoA hydratase/carnithine racemase